MINSLLNNEVGVLYKVIEPYDLVKKCEIVVPYEVLENDNFTNKYKLIKRKSLIITD
ncbi:hypothetical protein [Peptoniphilus vaginalis]|uniref:hypothetical protein n=1 Tax=Peptoniphilus vaginalis TaxID=1756987 RepID=UPI0023F7DB1E|nr:hypothetical protein [Peptoniphilus vaginalis]